MDYARARNFITSGDVIATSAEGWGSWSALEAQAVRIFTRSEYSHVGQVWVHAGRVWLLEAVNPHVQMVPLSVLAKNGFFWMPMDAPMSEREEVHAFAQVGVGRYSKRQAVAAFLRRLQIGADDSWQCAEYVIANRRLSGVDLGQVATPTAVVRHLMDAGRPLHRITGAG